MNGAPRLAVHLHGDNVAPCWDSSHSCSSPVVVRPGSPRTGVGTVIIPANGRATNARDELRSCDEPSAAACPVRGEPGRTMNGAPWLAVHRHEDNLAPRW